MNRRATEVAGARGVGRGLLPLAVVLGAGLVLLRQRGPGALDTLWAEDGEIFLQDALVDASPWGWLRSYAGYLHLAPRILASLAASLPLEWAPLVLSGGAALAAAAVALVSFQAAEEHIPSRVHRALLALALLVLPAAGLESANAAANIHWYLLAGLAWVALWRPSGPAGAWVGGAFLFVTAASDPFAVLAVPVLGWRLLRGAGRVERVFAGALGGGLLLQAGVVLSSAGSRSLDPLSTPPWILGRWYGFHVLEGAVFGVALRDRLNVVLGEVASGALALVALSILLMPCIRSIARSPRLVPASLAGHHLGLFFLPVALSGVSTSRYAVAPIMLLYGLVAWGSVRDAPGWRRLAARLAVAALILPAAIDFAPWNPRAEGPRWSEGLSNARRQCALALRGAVEVEVPPRPRRSEPDGEQSQRWTVQIPCTSLRDEPA